MVEGTVLAHASCDRDSSGTESRSSNSLDRGEARDLPEHSALGRSPTWLLSPVHGAARTEVWLGHRDSTYPRVQEDR